MILAIFPTLDLETLHDMIFDAGWDYVQGAVYMKKGVRGRLVMRDADYVMVAYPFASCAA